MTYLKYHKFNCSINTLPNVSSICIAYATYTPSPFPLTVIKDASRRKYVVPSISTRLYHINWVLAERFCYRRKEMQDYSSPLIILCASCFGSYYRSLSETVSLVGLRLIIRGNRGKVHVPLYGISQIPSRSLFIFCTYDPHVSSTHINLQVT